MNQVDPQAETIQRPPRSVQRLVAGLLFLHALMAWYGSAGKCTTFDEIAHLTAGVVNYQTGSFRFLPQSPPLPHLLAGFPLWAFGYEVPTSAPAYIEGDAYALGVHFFYESGYDAQAMLALSRPTTILLSAALGWLVWWWSRRLFGEAGGVLSLLLYALSPTMIAHAGLVTADVPAALFFLAAVTAIWRCLDRVSTRTTGLAALAIAGLVLSKYSFVLLGPMAAALVVIRLVEPAPVAWAWRASTQKRMAGPGARLACWMAAALVIVLLLAALIWLVYGLRMRMAERPGVLYPSPFGGAQRPGDAWRMTVESSGLAAWVGWLNYHDLLPEAFLLGFVYTVASVARRTAFLCGAQSLQGWWYYFPLAFFWKTPLALFGLLGTAALTWWRRGGAEGDKRPPCHWMAAPLVVLFAVYGVAVMVSSLNIGHRHLLPLYPVLFIAAGGAAARLASWRSVRGVAVGVLVSWFVGASLWIAPYDLAYFNETIGGSRHAYRYLVDSSLDWGGELPRLSRWLNAHNTGGKPVYLAYFGMGSPRNLGIDATMLPSSWDWGQASSQPLQPGIYAISATMLQQVTVLPCTPWTRSMESAYQSLRAMVYRLHAGEDASCPAFAPSEDESTCLSAGDFELYRRLRFARLCAALRSREPDAVIGYGIHVYDVDQEELHHAVAAPWPTYAPDQPEKLQHLARRAERLGSARAAVAFFEAWLAQRGDAPVTGEYLDTLWRLASLYERLGQAALAAERQHLLERLTQ